MSPSLWFCHQMQHWSAYHYNPGQYIHKWTLFFFQHILPVPLILSATELPILIPHSVKCVSKHQELSVNQCTSLPHNLSNVITSQYASQTTWGPLWGWAVCNRIRSGALSLEILSLNMFVSRQLWFQIFTSTTFANSYKLTYVYDWYLSCDILFHWKYLGGGEF